MQESIHDPEIETAVAAASTRRFTRRMSFFEDPAVAEWLEQHAAIWGRSLGSEMRSAIRYWMQAHESDDV